MSQVPPIATVQHGLPGGVPAWWRGQGQYGRGQGLGLREAAQGLEALFLEGVVKGLRRTTLGGGGREKTLYQALLDEELARACASRGVGLAKVLETRLGKACESNTPGPKGPLKVSDNGPITPSGAQHGPEKATRGRAWEGLERTGTSLQGRACLSGKAGDGTGLSAVGIPVRHPYGNGLELLPGVARRGVLR